MCLASQAVGGFLGDYGLSISINIDTPSLIDSLFKGYFAMVLWEIPGFNVLLPLLKWSLGGMNLNFNFLVHLFPKPLSTTLLLALENCTGIRAVFEMIVMLCLMVPLFRLLEGDYILKVWLTKERFE